MFRFAFLRWLCFILAVVTVIAIWWWAEGGAAFVNNLMATGKQWTSWLTNEIAYWSGKQRSDVSSVLKDKQHLDRTIIFSGIALLYSCAFELSFGLFAWSYWRWRLITHLYRTFFALLIVHGVLALWWIFDGNNAMWWYDEHERRLNIALSANGWHRMQTLAEVIHLHALMIFAEAFAVATLAVRFFHYVWLGLKWYFRVHW